MQITILYQHDEEPARGEAGQLFGKWNKERYDEMPVLRDAAFTYKYARGLPALPYALDR